MRFAHIALVIVLFSFSAQAETDGPFGFATVAAPQNRYVANWRQAQDDWAVEREMLDRCRANRKRCPSPAAIQFLEIVETARAQRGRARLGFVNRAINLAILGMNDLANYGIREIWTAPLATLARGAGDCTDYAIAKYYALGEVGVPANDRRIVVVSIKSQEQEHAVLAVREDQHWLILDNRSMTIVDAADDTQYEPLLEFDHRDVREFVKPALAHAARAACASSG
jgi:predicted transglutaminase-like cysteine proteinase